MSDSKPQAAASPLVFNPSEAGTLGVEMEWMTVDAETGAQVPAAPKPLASTKALKWLFHAFPDRFEQ